MNCSRAKAAALTVSPTPVPEVLRRLASQGLVRADAHRGASVRGLNDEALEEIYLLRQLLEPVVAQMAALHITEQQLAEAEALWRRMEDPDDPVEWSENNRRFHELIATAAHSPRLETIVKSLRDSSTVFVQWSLTAHSHRGVAANADHRDLIDALRAGDGELAAAIEARHLRGTLDAIRQRNEL